MDKSFGKRVLSGEDNMCHSLANLEYHHFKYQQFLKAGDVHIHYFGTATLSFADGIQAQVNDEFEIEMKEFGHPLKTNLLICNLNYRSVQLLLSKEYKMVIGHNFIGGSRSAQGTTLLKVFMLRQEKLCLMSFTMQPSKRLIRPVKQPVKRLRLTAIRLLNSVLFLENIADELDALGTDFLEIVSQETALPLARLQGERARTSGQMRLFAKVLRRGDFLGARIDTALPERQPLPRPDLRQIKIGVGPVAVFGASNFPLAFSTAGGDTASALAAGCSVVVKAHSGHMATADFVAQAIERAVEKSNMPKGVFNMIYGNGVGEPLVKHPLIQAVGFTGSLRGGRALCDMAAARPQPIPVFAEMSSINPMLMLPEALKPW